MNQSTDVLTPATLNTQRAWPRNLWPHRWLFLSLLEREIKNRYVGSLTGLFWAVLHPMLLLLVYALVFRLVFRVHTPEMEQHGFTAFVAMGLWPWLMLQEGVQRGALAIQNHAGLIKKVALPHELLVYATVAATFLVHGLGLMLVMLVLTLLGIPMHWGGMAAGLLWLLPLFLGTAGLGLGLSALQTLFRDVEHVLGPVFMVLFYATPVLYAASMVPEPIRTALQWNPLTHAIEPIRIWSLGLPWPHPLWAGAWAVGSVLLFLVGRAFFVRLSPYFEDFL